MTVRLTARPVRALLPKAPPRVRITTGSIGFLDATDDDRRRWMRGFRTLLDGLDAPLQVLVHVLVYGGAGPSASDGGARDRDGGSVPAPALRRALDLEHARRLREGPDAQRRTVTLVTTAEAAKIVERALVAFGLPEVRRRDDPTPPTVVHEGVELPGAWWDETGLYRTWYLDRYPGIELDPGWLLRLLPPGLELFLSWHAEHLHTPGVVDFLQRQLIQLRARQIGRNEVGEPEVTGALPAVQRLQQQLIAREENAFHVALYLAVRTHGPRELAAATTRIEAAARSSLVVLRRATFRQREGRVATSAFGLDPLRRQRVLDSSSATTLAPWWDADLQQPDGLLVGVSRRTGQPVVIDPFDERRFANANIGVFGHTGAGKTYLLSTLAISALDAGAQVFIIDPEHEYGGLATRLGGRDVRLSLGAGCALNVLDRRGGDLGGADEGSLVADTLDLCAVLCGGLDAAERADLEDVLRRTLSEEEAPLLQHVAARLEPSSRVARVLRRWATGSLGQMFSRPTNLDLDLPLVVFGMRELRPELVAPVHFLLAAGLWARIRHRDRRRLLIVDELGLLFEDPTIRGFVVGLARRIRKYDGALCFATQNPGDLLASEAGAVVATNPAIHFFGALRPGEAARIQKHFLLSDPQRAGLESAVRGDFLLSAAADRIPLRVVAPPWQASLLHVLRPPLRRAS